MGRRFLYPLEIRTMTRQRILEQHSINWECSGGRLMVLDVSGQRDPKTQAIAWQYAWIECPDDLMGWLGY